MSSKKPADKRRSDNKSQAPTKSTYRIPPKEMILTRNKSAQMKDKTKDYSATGVEETQPKTPPKTKSPAKTYASRKRPPKTNPTSKTSQSDKECSADVCEEFRPDNPKRDVSSKKVTLKPKQGLREIGSLNKRKRNIPRQNSNYVTKVAKIEPKKAIRKAKANVAAPKKAKSANSPKATVDPYSGLSMAEIIRLKDETEVLTDEDFMAILTCPSPVWWEENLEGINDEPINTIKQMKSKTSDDKGTVQKANTSNAEPAEVQENKLVVPEITEGKFEERFLKKRSLLENVLSNIKGNSHSNVRPQTEVAFNTIDKSSKDDSTPPSATEIDSQLKTTNARTQIKKLTKSEPIFLNKGNSNKVVFKTIKKIVPYRVPDSKIKEKERNSPSIESSFINELALKDLENIEIPVASAEPKTNLESPSTCNIELIAEKLPLDPCCSKSIDGILSADELVRADNDCPAKEITQENSLEAPTVLPTLQKCPISTPALEISESCDAVDSFSNTSLQDLSDTMSDTNIQFMSEDQNMDDEAESRKIDETLAVADAEAVEAENNVMVVDDEDNSIDTVDQSADTINRPSKNESAEPNAKDLFFLKGLNKLRLDPKNGKKQHSILKTNKDKLKVSQKNTKSQMLIVGTKNKKYRAKLAKLLKHSESFTDKDVQSSFAICEMQNGILRLKDDSTTQDLSNNNREIYEDKDCAQIALKDKENVKSSDKMKETKKSSDEVKETKKSSDKVKETNGVTDTQNGEIDKTMIIEKYSSILKKKFSDKTRRKLKNCNVDNHDIVSSNVNNERDVTVYTDVINGQKPLILTDKHTAIIEDGNETETREMTTKTIKKSISVSDKEHYNYCMHCSSIFDDTEVCTYCIKKCIDDRIIKNVASCSDCG